MSESECSYLNNTQIPFPECWHEYLHCQNLNVGNLSVQNFTDNANLPTMQNLRNRAKLTPQCKTYRQCKSYRQCKIKQSQESNLNVQTSMSEPHCTEMNANVRNMSEPHCTEMNANVRNINGNLK